MTEVKLGSRVLFIYIFCSLCNTRIFFPSAAVFLCKDRNQSVAVSSRCDSVYDCKDRSDEENCDNETVILYSTTSNVQIDDEEDWLNSTLSGVSLSHNQSFILYNSGHIHSEKIESAALSGSQLYVVVHLSDELYKPVSSILIRSHRDGSIISSMTFDGYGKPSTHRMSFSEAVDANYLTIINRYLGTSYIKDIAIDWITTNIYMLMFDRLPDSSWIQVCTDEKFFCTHLTNRLMKNPVKFVLSPKHGMLFWIEKKPGNRSFIASSQMDGSFPKVILKDLRVCLYLTVDLVMDRLYWIEDSSVYSSTFSGSDRKTIRDSVKDVFPSSVAVHNNMLYWIVEGQEALYSCSSDACFGTNTRKLLKLPSAESILGLQNTELNKSQIKNPCINSVCSDICLLATPTDFSCTCTADKSQRSELSSNGIYCEKTTLLATYGNDLYIIGRVLSGSPKIMKKSFNLQAISAVEYETKQGNVILVEKERNIYLWNPANNSTMLQTLVADEPDSVKSIEFDEFGNNLYWLSPRDYSIKAFSLTTHRTTVIYKGNSTYIPLDFTLGSNKGLMFIAFRNANSSVILLRTPMDGSGKYTKIICTMRDVYMDVLPLHYARNVDILYFVDKQLEELVYFPGASDIVETEFVDLSKNLHKPSTVNLSDSLTSLDNNLFWTDEELHIYSSLMYNMGVLTDNISVGISNVDKNKKLRIAAVVKTSVKQSPCLEEDNGGCEHLCLSSRNGSHVCACSANYTLEPPGACRMYLPVREAMGHTGAKTSSGWLIISFIAVILIAFSGYAYVVGFGKIRRSINAPTRLSSLMNDQDDAHSCSSSVLAK